METSAADRTESSTKPLVVDFAFERETPGTIRYREVDGDGRPVDQADAVVKNLYLRKALLKGARPRRVRATLELLDG